MDKTTELQNIFLGTWTPKMDVKGRFMLPSRFKEHLKNGLFITRGQENCLYIWPTDVFQSYYEKLVQLSNANQKARVYLRMFFSGAMDAMPDTQGRIQIPKQLKEYAKLTKELAVIGVGDRAEIWDSAEWNTYLKHNEQEYANATEDIFAEINLKRKDS
jgi:MraZ protein